MDKKQLVKKSNSLIESRCDLSLNQQKLVLAVIAMISREDDDFKEYRLSISEFRELMSLEGTGGYTEIRNAAKGIKEKNLIISIGENSELITSWFSDIELRYKGEIGFYISSKLKPYLLQLKEYFTAYKLENVLRLNSRYSIRLYELLKSHEYKNKPKIFNMDELKSLLYIEPEKYSRFDNFKARVLIPSISDVNKNTDLIVTYQAKRAGRKVIGIEFSTEKKQSPQRELFQPEENKPPQTIIDLIPQEHRKSCQQLCQQIFTKDGTEGLKFYIGKCNSRKQTPNGSYSGYLKTVFDLDLYADVKDALEAQVTAEKEIQKMRQQAMEAQKKQKMQEKEEQAALKAKHEALERLQVEDPDRYDRLEQQAADALGLNLKKPGVGGKLKITRQMFKLLEKS
ncbi:MAG: RepB family plasmid replication initiator protein [Desulfamplus sp.]|nr:RepB family plasmid replication initiator protein [Desulfamplus sp.]